MFKQMTMVISARPQNRVHKTSYGAFFLVTLLLCFLGFDGPTEAATWHSVQLSIGEPFHSAIHGISCPSTNLCVAAAENDTIAWSVNPTGPAGSWQLVQPYDASVESDDECTMSHPAACRKPPNYRIVRSISCPVPTLCIAVTSDGYVYSSTDPTGSPSSWRVADVDGTGPNTHLESVSCPDAGFCVAVSGNRDTAGKVLSSNNPAGPSSAWKVVQLDGEPDLRGVSCISRSACVAVGDDGRIFASSNADGGSDAWIATGSPGGPGALEAVSCVSQTSILCVSGNSGGNLLTTTDPTGTASAWNEVNGGGSVQITGTACPTARRCIAVDNNGAVLASTQPATGPWTRLTLIPYEPPPPHMVPLNALFAAQCPTTSLCIVGGANGRMFTSTDLFEALEPGSGPSNAGNRHKSLRPRTVIKRADNFHNLVGRRRHFHARFRFHASGPVRGFECKRDRRPYHRCHSPLRYWVPLGLHHLRVRAIGSTGLRGPVATVQFRAIAQLLPGKPGS